MADAPTVQQINSTAEFAGIIDVPLFQAPYTLPNIASFSFSPSSPYPHYSNATKADASGNFTYRDDIVLSPLQLTRLQVGNPTGAGAGDNAAYYNGTSCFLLAASPGGFNSSMELILPAGTSKTLARAPQNQNVWFNNKWGLGTGQPRAGLPLGFWLVPDNEDNSVSNFYMASEVLAIPQKNWIITQVTTGYTPPPGSDFFAATDQGAYNLLGYSTANSDRLFTAASAFTQLVGRNTVRYSSTVVLNNSNIHILAFYMLNSGELEYNPIQSILFDDPALQTLNINSNLNWAAGGGCDFGFVCVFNSSLYAPIKGQKWQALLLTGSYVGPGFFQNIRYSYLRFNPQNTFVANLLNGNAPNIKIDRSGIVHYAPPLQMGVANSFGIDVKIPGVQIPVNELTGNIGLPSFCPCSPVAIDTAGA